MKHIFTSVALVSIFMSLNGQIKVATNNNVGIGESSPVSKLSVNSPGDQYSTVFMDNLNPISSSRTLLIRNGVTSSSWGFSILATTPFTASSASKNVRNIRLLIIAIRFMLSVL